MDDSFTFVSLKVSQLLLSSMQYVTSFINSSPPLKSLLPERVLITTGALAGIADWTGMAVVQQAGVSGDTVTARTVNAQGTLNCIASEAIVVGDPLIYLAANNNSSDTLDIGFVGQYFKSSEIRAAGLFRDHEDGVFKLFRDLSRATSPGDRLISNNNVDTTDGTYVIATLQAYLDSGALVSNNLAVTITANSSVNVNITANSLSLSTALSSTSGGTGRGSYTTGDILVANTGNALSVLTLSSTAGHVLQSNGSALIYDILDGGTF
jgi:hypothetical protein